MTDRLAPYHPPPPSSACIERVPPSPRHMPLPFQSTEDSPSGKPSYTLLTSPSAAYPGHMPQHPGYLHSYNYGDMPPGMEKASRSKVLPNEVRLLNVTMSNCIIWRVVEWCHWLLWFLFCVDVSQLLNWPMFILLSVVWQSCEDTLPFVTCLMTVSCQSEVYWSRDSWHKMLIIGWSALSSYQFYIQLFKIIEPITLHVLMTNFGCNNHR